MLRSSRYVKLTLGKSISRCFSYQKDIYMREFDSEESIRGQLPRDVIESRSSQPNLYRYINAYHKYGFKLARLDPLGLNYSNSRVDELDPSVYGLRGDSKFAVDNLLFKSAGSQLELSEIESYLKKNYSSHTAIEFDHLQNEEEKLWLAQNYESINSSSIDSDAKLEMLKLLLKSQAFDLFLGSKFPTFKRYSLEGGESSLAFYYSTFLNLANRNFFLVLFISLIYLIKCYCIVSWS